MPMVDCEGIQIGFENTSFLLKAHQNVLFWEYAFYNEPIKKNFDLFC